MLPPLLGTTPPLVPAAASGVLGPFFRRLAGGDAPATAAAGAGAGATAGDGTAGSAMVLLSRWSTCVVWDWSVDVWV